MSNPQNSFTGLLSRAMKRGGKQMAQVGLATQVQLFSQDYQKGRISQENWQAAERSLRAAAKELDLHYPGDPPPPPNQSEGPRVAPSVVQ